MNRPVWFQASLEGAKAVGTLHHFVTKDTGLPSLLTHLVFLRVSQINGCAHCIDIHTRDLLAEGMPGPLLQNDHRHKGQRFFERDPECANAPEIVERLGRELVAIICAPEMVQQIDTWGMEALGVGPGRRRRGTGRGCL